MPARFMQMPVQRALMPVQRALWFRSWGESDSDVVFTTGAGMAMVCRGTAGGQRNAVNVFVICAADSIERSNAKAFSLSRINEAGESRPFSIVVIRTHANDYFGYVNSCPHRGIWLNFGEGSFFTPDRAFLKCGRHGSVFEIDTGLVHRGTLQGQEPRADCARRRRRRSLHLRRRTGGKRISGSVR